MAHYIYHQELHPSKHAEFRRVFEEPIRRIERTAAVTSQEAEEAGMIQSPLPVLFGAIDADAAHGVFVVIDFLKPPQPRRTLDELVAMFSIWNAGENKILLVRPTTPEQRAILINPGAPSGEALAFVRAMEDKKGREQVAKTVAKRKKNRKKNIRKRQARIRKRRAAAATRIQAAERGRRGRNKAKSERYMGELLEFSNSNNNQGGGGGRRKTKRRRRRKRRKTRRKRRRRRRRTRKR